MERFLDLIGTDGSAVARAVVAILISLLVLFIALRVVNSLFKRTERRMAAAGRNTGYLRYFRYVVRAALYIVCLGAALSNIPGVSSMLTGLLAGSGIVAVVVGFASQEAVGNIVSGAMLLLFHPFKVGDTVRYISEDVTGVVEEVGLRHTAIRTPENKRLLIPNSLMNNNVVENASCEDPAVSVCLDVGITYSADTARAMAVMGEVISTHPGFTDRRSDEDRAAGVPAALVRIREFGDSAVILRCWVWAENTTASFQLKSDLLLAIKTRFEGEGIGIAYPTISIAPADEPGRA